MLKVKKQIKNTIFKIAFVLCVVIITGLYWDNLNIKKYETIANMYNNANYIDFDIEAENGYVLNDINNVSANNDSIKLNVYNETYFDDKYAIALKIDKGFDFSKLNITIDNKLYNLSEIYTLSDDKYNYFTIVSDKIKGSKISYNLGLYINPSDINYFNNNNIDLEFINLNKM